MKVLITGGYGFIGSHVAEQFYKEGFEVHIIDNFSSGKSSNITFKHKSYNLSVDDPKCKDVFASFHFDTVVHLAAQVSVASSVANPMHDAQINIVGLLNMLQLSSQYHVKKFIFASSAAVYGNNANLPLFEHEQPSPISPYGMSKWAGEEYCASWTEEYGLETICLRFSNVYGPRQTHEGEGGVISIFASKLMHDETLVINGDGKQTRDFIYVEDVAFAIYRASQSIAQGVFNLSTNTEESIDDIIQYFEKVHGKIDVSYASKRDGDIYRSSLNNDKVKQMLSWAPLYSLEEGIEKTYDWAKSVNLKVTKKIPEKTKRTLPPLVVRMKPYIENFLLFLVVSAIVLSLSLPFLSTFEFGVFYIMIVGSIYGNRQAFFGVILAFLLLVGENLVNGREFVALLYDATFLLQTAIFLFVGLVVGYSVQRKNKQIFELKEQLSDLQNRYDFLEELHTEVREVKDELQLRLINNEDSFGKIYSIIKELDNLEPEKIFSSTVNVIEKIMGCEDVAIYSLNQHQSYLRLVAYSDSSNQLVQGSLKVADTPYIQKVIESNNLYVNHHLVADVPLMSAPIYHNNEIKAIITINGLSFENFSTYHENLFIVVRDLIQASLSRAFDYIKITEEQRYIAGTLILQPQVFKEIWEAKELALHSKNIPYTLMGLPTTLEQLPEISPRIDTLLRETDYVSFQNDTLYVLLSNTQESDLPFILTRFEKAGFVLENQQRVFK